MFAVTFPYAVNEFVDTLPNKLIVLVSVATILFNVISPDMTFALTIFAIKFDAFMILDTVLPDKYDIFEMFAVMLVNATFVLKEPVEIVDDTAFPIISIFCTPTTELPVDIPDNVLPSPKT
ncbi:hypothetical protein PBCV1_a024R [Paramecium bursaria Chlorella virus 1]|uniref:Uncharacterized protein n=1 Tax=Paramecium bursaria Chlorella virus 1 TaxID=10506 RepID=Q89359_PBCV1|nr:hypothetical protein PBCV1_a024R [Paramecium bursaria Chlorella virus 1]AAC96392.1 hypothetical protein [Paramecium bursaria Chlorella virus 1]